MNQSDHNENGKARSASVRSNWVVIAEEASRIIAEFAINGLKSYDIPAVLDAKPGFLGTAGMQLRSLKTGKLDKFKIMVPAERAEEASEIVKIFLGSGQQTDDDLNEYEEE